MTSGSEATVGKTIDSQEFSLGGFQKVLDEQLANFGNREFAFRLWFKDASLWSTEPGVQRQIRESLGWLEAPQKMKARREALEDLIKEVKAAGFKQAVHMGMGGCSLTALVLARTFTPAPGALPLKVLDTTDPASIDRLERSLPLKKTLFIVACKSGTTAEPLAFCDYFYQRLKDKKGNRTGDNFIALTDPASPLMTLAKEKRFRHCLLDFPDIGSRYAAISHFGLLPAALMGLDVPEIIARAMRMRQACTFSASGGENPGVALGVALGELARRHRDKVTFVIPQAVSALGLWLEQLLAESTGKDGKGLLPVADEPIGDPSVYGNDRIFVHLRLPEAEDRDLVRSLEILHEAGHPLITIGMEDPLDMGQEFFRWEMAAATAGAVLGINPFDQPDVQESRDNTNRLLQLVEENGKLPDRKPALVEGPLEVYGEKAAATAAGTLSRFLRQARPGDYLALQAFLPESPETHQSLQDIRLTLRNHLHLATTLGYGPRFLHSTSQFHKGGPNKGLFIQLTAREEKEVPIPGRPYGFGLFKQAQALGDGEILQKHGRRLLRLHLREPEEGLHALGQMVQKALKG